ncbi:MAG TPA: diguanylate cyclase [Selenomonadales bacterium]|nr:diguanylate cyclase [Selenomonadales bacterium]
MTTPALHALNPKHAVPILAVFLFGFLSFGGLTSLALDPPHLLISHGLFEIACIVLGFIIFFITWYGAGNGNNFQVTAISLVVLSVSILELVHVLSFPGMFGAGTMAGHVWASSWVVSRLVWSLGMLYAATLPMSGGTAPHYASKKALLYCTLIATVGLAASTLFGFTLWPALSISAFDQPAAEYIQRGAFLIDFLTLIILYRRLSDHAGNLPLYALLFGTLADFSFSLVPHTTASLNVAGHFFKVLANLYILRLLYIFVIQRPFDEVIRLKENMEELADKNAKLYQESERQRGLFEDILAKIGMIISSQLHLEETLDAIADMVADMMGARQSAIALFGKDRSSLQVVATYGFNSPPDFIPLCNSLAGQVCAEKTASSIDDLALHPELFRPQLIFTSIRSIICAPLINDKEIIGVIEAYSSEKNAFNERDVLLLKALGYHAGAAIASAMLYEQTKLRLNEEQFLYQIAQSAAATIDTDTIMQQCVSHTARALNADMGLGFLLPETNLKSVMTFKASFGLNCKPGGFDLGAFPELNEKVSAIIPVTASPDIFPPLKDLCTESSPSTIMLMPLPVDSRILGLIILGWRRSLTPDQIDRTSFAALMAQQVALGIEKAHLYNQVKAMALSDGLTGLANRRNFDMFLNTEIRRAATLKRPLSLIMFDLDKFKVYNDTYGHPTGDKLLTQIGKILQESVRNIDFPARYGGEEFSVILPECPNSEVLTLAEKIRDAVEQSYFPDNTGTFTARITASLGVATYDPALAAPPDAVHFIAVADDALYRAKQQGRNRVMNGSLIN